MKSYAFNRGYRQISPNDRDRFIKAVMRILKVQTVQSYYVYCRGERELKISQAVALEKLFAKYGVAEIWGKR